MAITADDIAATEQPDWSQRPATALGAAPMEWGRWTWQAEKGLVQSLALKDGLPPIGGPARQQNKYHQKVPRRNTWSRH